MRARRTAVVIGVLATVAAVAGCSAGPDVVAEVEGTTITEADLDRTIADLGPMLVDSSRGTVLSAIVQSIALLEPAERNDIDVSDERAGDFLDSRASELGLDLSGWGEGSLALARAQLVLQDLAGVVGVEEANAQLEEALTSADVTVSPRYGEYDPASGGVVALSPDWIVEPAAAEPAAG